MRSIDILPTVIELLKLPATDTVDGRSLLVAEEGPAAETFASLYMENRELHSLTALPWKLLFDRIAGEETLFNLARDPYERTPVDVAEDAEAHEVL